MINFFHQTYIHMLSNYMYLYINVHWMCMYVHVYMYKPWIHAQTYVYALGNTTSMCMYKILQMYTISCWQPTATFAITPFAPDAHTALCNKTCSCVVFACPVLHA